MQTVKTANLCWPLYQKFKDANYGAFSFLLAEDAKYGGPEEPLRKDALEGKRKEEREAHQTKKKRLKRHWKKIKDKQVC